MVHGLVEIQESNREAAEYREGQTVGVPMVHFNGQWYTIQEFAEMLKKAKLLHRKIEGKARGALEREPNLEVSI